jgi:hypothetical protein
MSYSIYPKPKEELTDLELIDLFIDFDVVGPDPRLMRDICDRGLLWVVNRLPGNNKAEEKAAARAKLASRGLYTEDDDISKIQFIVGRIEALKGQLSKTDSFDFDKVDSLVNSIRNLSRDLRDWMK